MNGREMIEYERRRQTTEEGWSIQHDDSHTAGELYDAGIHYLVHGITAELGDPRVPTDPPWPFGPEWWKPSTPTRDLVRAGALLLAETDRLRRIVTAPGYHQPVGGADEKAVRAMTIAAIIDGIAGHLDRLKSS